MSFSRCSGLGLALLLSVVVGRGAPAAPPESIRFPAPDGLEVTADLYRAHDSPTTPFILLFHQAGWSRGEYREIAPVLNELGFNCLAVDQRSGGEVNGVSNETAARARKAGKGTSYVDALADLEGAILFVKRKHARGKLILWGSSYSAALVLKVAGEDTRAADGVLAFAPGEYFTRAGKPKDWIRTAAAKISCPVFITSARRERAGWAPIFEAIPSRSKVAFLPEAEGQHGSRALWKKFDPEKEYWTAVEDFLKKNFLKP